MTGFLWAGFILFVLVMLALDLGVANRGVHTIGARRALAFTSFFVALALGFNVLVYFMYKHHWLGIGVRVGQDLTGEKAAIQFFTGWLMEYSLSLDNIFVIALIFRHLAVPREQQHRVLFWGILGALVMRGAMIGVGAALLRQFHWMIYVFGAVLLITAIRLLFTGNHEPEPEQSWIMRTARRILPLAPVIRPGTCPECGHDRAGLSAETVCPECAAEPPEKHAFYLARAGAPREDHFFRRVGGRLYVTPLFLVLIVVEFTDVIFAVDSIPAIFGVTRDPFLVFTSNVFAILGLRSLYFALAAIIDKFRYLKTSLVFVLLFIAVKMLIPEGMLKIPDELSLAVIGGILAAGILLSLGASAREKRRRARPVDDIADVVEEAWRRSRRVVILVVGLTILGLSIPIGLLPGPGGIAVALGGLALLATEFVWARKLLKGFKTHTRTVAARADGFFFKTPRPWLIPIVVGLAALATWALLRWEPTERRHILLFSIGPWLAIAFWAAVTIRRWLEKQRLEHARVSTPDTEA
jgi:tellurite resistance protein TerC